jgi:ubiquinone biosynthesis protein COQ4
VKSLSALTTEIAAYSRPAGIVPERRDWRRFFSCWRGFTNTGKNKGKEYEAYLALLAPSSARQYYQVCSHPNGRKLLRDKPDLLAVLADEAYLDSLPAGTVGHAYRSYMTTNDLLPGVYDEATIFRPIAERSNWSEDFYWLMRRTTALHDLFHVIGGYGTDVAGEVQTMGFQFGQIEPAGPLGKVGYLLAAVVPGAPIAHKLRVYHQAVERGRRADKLAAALWEELLDKPVDEVRAILGVAPSREAHPAGTWRTNIRPIGLTKPVPWDYEEVLARDRAT